MAVVVTLMQLTVKMRISWTMTMKWMMISSIKYVHHKILNYMYFGIDPHQDRRALRSPFPVGWIERGASGHRRVPWCGCVLVSDCCGGICTVVICCFRQRLAPLILFIFNLF